MSQEKSADALEQLTEGIIEVVPGGLAHVNADGSIVRANAEACRILGYSYDEMSQRYTADWDAETIWEDGTLCRVEDYPVSKAMMTGEPQPPVTIGVRRPDGALSWAVFSALPLKDPTSGELSGAVVSFLDITDHKILEDASHESRAQLRSVLESVPSYIIAADTDGTIQFINRVSQDIDPAAGLTVDSVVGQRMAEMVNERDRAMVRDAIAKVVRDNVIVDYEIKGLDGVDRAWYAVRIGPVVRDGEVVGVTAVASDITERKCAEAERAKLLTELSEAQRLEAIGRLAGGVAHDFNNLLSVIQGNVDLLHARMVGTSHERSLNDISGAADRAAALTRQLLAFGGKQSMEPRDVDLGDLVSGVTVMLSRLLGEDTELVVECNSELGLVHADPLHIERVVVNLAANGRDAMPEGGKLSIKTHNVEMAEGDEPGVSEGSYVAVDVIDSGDGIDDETQRHMFEPFYTTKEQGRGTGLGLAMVHGIVRQSGGHVLVSSTPGEGTRFRILLPRVFGRQAAPHRRRLTPLSRRRPGTGTILLVEDEPNVRAVARTILEEAGYRVVVAESSEVAAASTDSLDHIDLLLSDVVMPKLSGPKLAETLTRRSPRMKVLFMSGYTNTSIEARGLSTENVAFLHKPFSASSLRDMVRSVLGD